MTFVAAIDFSKARHCFDAVVVVAIHHGFVYTSIVWTSHLFFMFENNENKLPQL